jgi:hypothetical protein
MIERGECWKINEDCEGSVMHHGLEKMCLSQVE